MGITEPQGELRDVIDINIVRETVAISVVSELAALDENMAGRIVSSKNPIFVSVDVAPPDRQVRSQLPDGCSIVRGSFSPGELDVFDGCVVAGDQPSRPAAKALADGIDFRAPIHTDSHQAVSGPTASIPVVVAAASIWMVSPAADSAAARQGVEYWCPGPTRSTAALPQAANIKNAQMGRVL